MTTTKKLRAVIERHIKNLTEAQVLSVLTQATLHDSGLWLIPADQLLKIRGVGRVTVKAIQESFKKNGMAVIYY